MAHLGDWIQSLVSKLFRAFAASSTRWSSTQVQLARVSHYTRQLTCWADQASAYRCLTRLKKLSMATSPLKTLLLVLVGSSTSTTTYTTTNLKCSSPYRARQSHFRSRGAHAHSFRLSHSLRPRRHLQNKTQFQNTTTSTTTILIPLLMATSPQLNTTYC